ncbi:MAG: trypsin-like peptidase domain-containing protein [Hyphomicrobiales bacterium]|nr:trypsin-like peptidase domain-containing protein [Hyphomicrobiales bacterium]
MRDLSAAAAAVSRRRAPGLAALAVAVALSGVALPGSAAAAAGCKAPEPVCAARAGVFRVSAFDPHGSAVRISADLLVTNRHVVADETEVQVHLADGGTVEGAVVPTSFAGDLVLVRAKLPEGPVLAQGTDTGGDLYTVAQNIATRKTQVFPKGRRILDPDADKPYARLHHTAYSQPGTSGGAVVTAKGALVGIATSGGQGRFEAVPAAQIAALEAASGPDHATRSAAIGKAYRECTVLVEAAMRSNDVVPESIAGDISRHCDASGNRQLYDLAAQVLGRSRMFDQSAAFFEKALDKDPNAVNSRIGYVVTLSFARRHADAVPHVRWLLKVVPTATAVQRFAVQIGKLAGDKALTEKGLALIAKHNPAQLEAAKRFVDAPAPSQPRRGSGR